jgi:hypothetical protein
MSDGLRAARLDALGAHLWSGDENDLINVEISDLGLPASTRSAEIRGLRYNGGLDMLGEEPRATDTLVEYECGYTIAFTATLPADDARANGWHPASGGAGFVTVEADLAMLARIGVAYDADEASTGGIEYIGLSRADGTPSSPVGADGDGATLYEFKTPPR